MRVVRSMPVPACSELGIDYTPRESAGADRYPRLYFQRV